MEREVEARALSLYASLIGWACTDVWLPCGVLGLPLVGHSRCPQLIQSGDEAD